MEKHQSFEALRLSKNQAQHIRLNNKGKQSLSIIRNETSVPKNNTLTSATDRTLSKLLPISKSTNLMNSSNISGLTVSDGKGPISLNQKRNFYHHTTIFRMDEYKDLTKQHFYLVDNNIKPEDIMNSKMEEAQRKIMISDFKRKVVEFLLTAKYKRDAATKNFRKYYTDLKLKTQSIDASLHQSYVQNIGTYQWDNQGEAFAQNQLSMHRYNQAGFTVQVKDSKGKVQKKIIQNQKIQQRLLRKLEPFLNNDKIDYDQKMRYMLLQFETIVDRLESEAFYMQLPTYCKENPSDYNDYYDVDPIQKKRYYETYLHEKILDELVEHVKNPVDDGFFSRPNTAELLIQEEQIRLAKEKEQKIREEQENNDQRSSDEEVPELDEHGNPTGRKIKREKLKREPKSRGHQQNGQDDDNDLPPIGPIQRNLEEEALLELQRQKEMDKLREEERERQKLERKREIERLEQEIQNKKNQADPEFRYQRGQDNDPQFKKKERKKQDQQQQAPGEKKKKTKREPRQKPPGIEAEAEGQALSTNRAPDESPKRGQGSLNKAPLPPIQVSHPNKNPSQSPRNNRTTNRERDSINRQDSMVSQVGSQNGENSSINRTGKLQSEHSQLQTKNQSQLPSHREGQVNDLNQSQMNQSQIIDEASQQQHQDVELSNSRKATQPNQEKEQDVRKSDQKKQAENLTNQLTSTQNDTNKMRNEMAIKLSEIEGKLSQTKANVFELLMNAANVYDVNIDEYKLNHQDSQKVDVPNIDGEDEKSIYREIYSWREEVINLIPILKEVRKDAKPALEEKSEESDSDDDEEDNKKKKKKKRKDSDDSD